MEGFWRGLRNLNWASSDVMLCVSICVNMASLFSFHRSSVQCYVYPDSSVRAVGLERTENREWKARGSASGFLYFQFAVRCFCHSSPLDTACWFRAQKGIRNEAICLRSDSALYEFWLDSYFKTFRLSGTHARTHIGHGFRMWYGRPWVDAWPWWPSIEAPYCKHWITHGTPINRGFWKCWRERLKTFGNTNLKIPNTAF